jgi:lipopolysaccharide transport system permease protein
VTTAEWEITSRPDGVVETVVDVFRHRRLLGFLVGRSLRRVYQRTVLGWLWLLIRPLFPLALRTLIFGALIGVTSEGIPYFLFLLAGSIAWDTFASSLTWGTRGLEMNRHLIDQIYLPRALLPFGNMGPALVEFAIKLAVFAIAVVYYGIVDDRIYLRGGVPLLWACAALLLMFGLAAALSFFTSVWGESVRDMRFALNQLLAVWYLLTPVLYPLSAVDERHRHWMLLNPLAMIVETFKWGLFGIGELRPLAFGITVATVLALMLAGLAYFSRAGAQALDER